jgi:recombination protein RecT
MADTKTLAVLSRETREWMQDPKRLEVLARALPKGVTPEQFMSTVLTTHLRIPKLYQTTRQSRWIAITRAASLGLPIDGRYAALVPFKAQAELIVMAQGWTQLMYRHPKVSMIHPVIVYEGDAWEYREGLPPRIRHTPLRRDAMPKVEEIVAVYAWAQVRGGGRPFRWMWKHEIDANHRDKSRSYRAGEGGWIEFPHAMYLKTPVIQLAKLTPQSVELQVALATEPDHEEPYEPLPVPAGATVDDLLDAIAGDKPLDAETEETENGGGQ